MDMIMESDQVQALSTSSSQVLHSAKRPRRSLQSSTPFTISENASPSPLPSSQVQLTPEVINHVNGLIHLDDEQIFHLLKAARSQDRSSISTFGSRSSYLSIPSRTASVFSDPRSSIASTDTSYSSYSAGSRWSQASRLSQPPVNGSAKNFACTFCDKALKSKPYWKSHEEEFHEQRKTWRCPDCEQIFNAGKRFREHHFKLHGCENCKQPKENGQANTRRPSPCVKKVERIMHVKDAYGCGHCACLMTSWEERCEHVASHFEEGGVKWNFTNVILGLLKQADVSEAWKALLIEKHGNNPLDWPQFTWDSKKSHRLRFSLETQWDIRSFDVLKLVQQAYDLAVIERTSTEPKKMDTVEEEDTLLPSDTDLSMPMELDPLDPSQVYQQSPWPAHDLDSKHLSHSESLDSFAFAGGNLTQMPNDFHHQQSWTDPSFLPHSDLVAFQQPGAYMNYTTKGVETGTQFDNCVPYPRTTSSPFLSSTPDPTPQKWTPRLVNIPSRREAIHEHLPPPPPPKDTVRASQVGIRRRADNPARRAVIPLQQWQNEYNWT